jgi:multimeric flavodoxin WrbA
VKIALLIHSNTGNTLSVAQRLRAELEAAGHQADILAVKAREASGGLPRSIAFDSIPDLASYEGIVAGAPVQAFSPAPVMAAFLKRLPRLEGKTAGCFVTQGFPFSWMGGNRSVRLMKRLLKKKGAAVAGSGVVNWGRSCRERLIEQTVERLAGLFPDVPDSMTSQS